MRNNSPYEPKHVDPEHTGRHSRKTVEVEAAPKKKTAKKKATAKKK